MIEISQKHLGRYWRFPDILPNFLTFFYLTKNMFLFDTYIYEEIGKVFVFIVI